MEAPLIPVRGRLSQKSNLRDVVVDLAGGVEVLVWTLARWRTRYNWLALFEQTTAFLLTTTYSAVGFHGWRGRPGMSVHSVTLLISSPYRQTGDAELRSVISGLGEFH